MTYFIRNSKNYTIVDIDFFSENNDVSAVVDIEEYTKFLLSLPENKMVEFSVDMSTLQEIRELWFERYIEIYKDGLKSFCKELMIIVAKKWDLGFVED